MPFLTTRLSKRDLLEKVTTAIKACGWHYLVLFNHHPFRLRVFKEHEAYTIKLYIWRLTHGGGSARPADEFRIQITSHVSQFEPEPQGKTLIVGWWEQAGVFAGFDYRKRTGRLGSSPSLQIRRDALEEAYQTLGLSPCNKGNQEIAIAFHPEFIIEYIRSFDELHDVGKVREDLAVLNEFGKNPDGVNDATLEKVTAARRKALQSALRTIRDTSFRKRVLTSYGYTCSMCSLQLELVEAAHVVPATEPDSTDETSNGLALCILHHRAYDAALVTVTNTYHVKVSRYQKRRLKEVGHEGGLPSFLAGLRPIIHLPPAIRDRPNVHYLERGRKIRHWKD